MTDGISINQFWKRSLAKRKSGLQFGNRLPILNKKKGDLLLNHLSYKI
jgi:hypothetical protein